MKTSTHPPMRPLALVAAVTVALGMSGCTMLGPNFDQAATESSAQVNDDWVGQGGEIETTPAQYKDWWQAFNDPILNQLMDKAYQGNLDLQGAGIRILQARAILGFAVGAQYPQSQFGAGGYSRTWPSTNVNPTKNLPSELRNSANDPVNSYDASFNASWEADFWGKFKRGIESADADLLSSIASYDNLLVILTGEVAARYVQIRTFQDRIKVAKDNIGAQRRSLRIANVRFQNGATTELDVQQARALLANSEASVPSFERQLRQANNALTVLLGMRPGELDALLGEGPIPTPPTMVAVGVPADLVRRRPDIRVAELQARSQSARIGATEANLYPSFGVSGTIGLTTAAASRFFEGDSTFGIGSVGFTWNILNYGRIKNQVRVQDALFQEALVNYRNSVLNAAQEVEDGLVGFIKTQEQEGFLKKAVKASARSVQLSLIQYRDGATDYQRVINSQQDLFQQQDQLSVARGNVAGNLVSVYRALGGGWELREGNPFVPEATQQTMRDRTDWGKLLEPTALDEDKRDKVAW